MKLTINIIILNINKSFDSVLLDKIKFINVDIKHNIKKPKIIFLCVKLISLKYIIKTKNVKIEKIEVKINNTFALIFKSLNFSILNNTIL